jgi:undecaprenyl-diphosphatase
MQKPIQTWRVRFRRVKTLAALNVVLFCASVFLFFLIVAKVGGGEPLPFEIQLMEALRTGEPARAIGPGWLVRVARDITALGSIVVLNTITILIVGFLLMTRRFAAAVFLVATAAGGQLLNAALKFFYGRERPDPAFRWIEIDSLSFPSGHATSSAVIYLTLAVLLMRLTQNKSEKFYIVGCALTLSFLVGLTRVYLGVHYPTDVIAGWAVGIAWAQFCWFAALAIGRRRLGKTG